LNSRRNLQIQSRGPDRVHLETITCANFVTHLCRIFGVKFKR